MHTPALLKRRVFDLSRAEPSRVESRLEHTAVRSSRGSEDSLSFSVAVGILRLLLPHLPRVHRNVIKSLERTRNDAARRGTARATAPAPRQHRANRLVGKSARASWHGVGRWKGTFDRQALISATQDRRPHHFFKLNWASQAIRRARGSRRRLLLLARGKKERVHRAILPFRRTKDVCEGTSSCNSTFATLSFFFLFVLVLGRSTRSDAVDIRARPTPGAQRKINFAFAKTTTNFTSELMQDAAGCLQQRLMLPRGRGKLPGRTRRK